MFGTRSIDVKPLVDAAGESINENKVAAAIDNSPIDRGCWLVLINVSNSRAAKDRFLAQPDNGLTSCGRRKDTADGQSRGL